MGRGAGIGLSCLTDSLAAEVASERAFTVERFCRKLFWRKQDDAMDHVTTPKTPPLHRAAELTAGGSLALIDLQGQIYTLRITKAGKLILTK